MSDYSRRRLLAIGGGVTIGAVAGCLGDQETAEATSESEGPILEAITLENLNSRSHTLDIIIQWDDEIEYWQEHTLSAASEADSNQQLADDWPTDPGEFQVTIRLDDQTPVRFSSTELPARDCQRLVIIVSRTGELSILTDVDGGACVDDSPDSPDSIDSTDSTDDPSQHTEDETTNETAENEENGE